jgi:hypothetical protein
MVKVSYDVEQGERRGRIWIGIIFSPSTLESGEIYMTPIAIMEYHVM